MEKQQNDSAEVVAPLQQPESGPATEKGPPADEKNDSVYAYLNRNDFTSEKYKVEIRGLPKFYGFGELKKLITNTLNLKCTKVKPPRRGCSWAYACLRSEEDRLKAIEVINGYQWKKSTLKASIAQAAPDPLVNKRKHEGRQNNGEPRDKKPCSTQDHLSREERLKNNTTPYWNMSYDEQKKLKYKDMRTVLLNLGKDLLKSNPDLKPWILEQRNKNNGLICPLEDVRSAEPINGYRNKCEFAIGINSETNQPTVGFRLGRYNEGSVDVGSVDELLHVPQRMKDVVKAMEKFVISSGKEPYDHETHDGYWRQLTVRLGSATDQLLLVATLHPQKLSEDEITKIKSDLVDFFSKGEGSSLKIHSLYFQCAGAREAGSKQPPMEHLWGDTHIEDIVLGVKFRISPEAFFQVNTAACEQLYTTIGDVAGLTQETTLVDVCCGAGTIGLCLAGRCKQVLGLELIEQAVEDARKNATANGITNSEFFAGRAENILGGVFQRATSKDMVAVVDPPRAGLQQKAVVTLRRTHNLKRLVYASCDPKLATRNFIDFGRQSSKTMRGHPLVPIRAIPVDMFPHTKLCELIIYFERINVNEIDDGNANVTETDDGNANVNETDDGNANVNETDDGNTNANETDDGNTNANESTEEVKTEGVEIPLTLQK